MKINVRLAFGADLEFTFPDAMNLINFDMPLKLAETKIKEQLDASLQLALRTLSAMKVTARLVKSGVKIEKVDT